MRELPAGLGKAAGACLRHAASETTKKLQTGRRAWKTGYQNKCDRRNRRGKRPAIIGYHNDIKSPYLSTTAETPVRVFCGVSGNMGLYGTSSVFHGINSMMLAPKKLSSIMYCS